MSDECRKEFEEWYTIRYLGVNIGASLDRGGEGYNQLDTHYCWLGFHAAWHKRAITPTADNALPPNYDLIIERGKRFARNSKDTPNGDAFQDLVDLVEYLAAVKTAPAAASADNAELVADAIMEYLPNSPSSMGGVHNPYDPTGSKWAREIALNIAVAAIAAMNKPPANKDET